MMKKPGQLQKPGRNQQHATDDGSGSLGVAEPVIIVELMFECDAVTIVASTYVAWSCSACNNLMSL
jgi:hypothetical protein